MGCLDLMPFSEGQHTVEDKQLRLEAVGAIGDGDSLKVCNLMLRSMYNSLRKVFCNALMDT